MSNEQLTLEAWFSVAAEAAPLPCAHERLCNTHAYVPAGLFCVDCDTLLLQYIPQSPAVLGYLSAAWAWKYKDNNEWTTEWPK